MNLAKSYINYTLQSYDAGLPYIAFLKVLAILAM